MIQTVNCLLFCYFCDKNTSQLLNILQCIALYHMLCNSAYVMHFVNEMHIHRHSAVILSQTVIHPHLSSMLQLSFLQHHNCLKLYSILQSKHNHKTRRSQQ